MMTGFTFSFLVFQLFWGLLILCIPSKTKVNSAASNIYVGADVGKDNKILGQLPINKNSDVKRRSQSACLQIESSRCQKV